MRINVPTRLARLIATVSDDDLRDAVFLIDSIRGAQWRVLARPMRRKRAAPPAGVLTLRAPARNGRAHGKEDR